MGMHSSSIHRHFLNQRALTENPGAWSADPDQEGTGGGGGAGGTPLDWVALETPRQTGIRSRAHEEAVVDRFGQLAQAEALELARGRQTRREDARDEERVRLVPRITECLRRVCSDYGLGDLTLSDTQGQAVCRHAAIAFALKVQDYNTASFTCFELGRDTSTLIRHDAMTDPMGWLEASDFRTPTDREAIEWKCEQDGLNFEDEKAKAEELIQSLVAANLARASASRVTETSSTV